MNHDATAHAHAPSDTSIDSAAVHSLGHRLRTLRKTHSRSLAEVAEATGISASFLSLVENGKSDMTIGRLARLVTYFGVEIESLFPTASERWDPITVVPSGTGSMLKSPAEGIEISLLASGPSRQMSPMLLEFEPGARLSDYGYHRGEEFVYVVEGMLEIAFEGRAPVMVSPGGSINYPAEIPHLFRNADERAPLRIICVDLHGSWAHADS